MLPAYSSTHRTSDLAGIRVGGRSGSSGSRERFSQQRHAYRGTQQQATQPDLWQALGQLSQGVGALQRAFEPLPANFPPGPGGNAAVGMLQDPLGFISDATKNSNIVGLRLGPEAVVLVADPAAARQIMIDQASCFGKEGTAFFPGSKLAGNGLLVSDGALWKRQRQLSNPAFRSAAIKVYTQAMAAATEKLLASTWAGGGERDIYADLNQLTLDIVTEVLFGWDIPRQQAQTIVGAIKAAFEWFANQAGIGIPEWVPLPGTAQYLAAVERLDEVIYDIIRTRRQELESGSRQPKCLMDQLLTSTDDDGAAMSEQALRDELLTLLVAGQETSAVLLSWALAFLAHNPAWQQACAAEVRDQLQGSTPTAENIGSLTKLEWVLLETLRLKPPAYLVGRCCHRPVQLQGWSLQEGTTCLISPYLLHRNRTAWGQPEAFLPDRWASMRPDKPMGSMSLLQGMGPNGCYLPFGAGPRNCIGTGFAMTEALAVLAAVLQRVELQPLLWRRFPAAQPRITLRPGPVKMYLKPRL